MLVALPLHNEIIHKIAIANIKISQSTKRMRFLKVPGLNTTKRKTLKAD